MSNPRTLSSYRAGTSSARRILVVANDHATHDAFRKMLQSPLRSQHLGPQAPAFELETALSVEEATAKLTDASAAGRPYCIAFLEVSRYDWQDSLRTVRRLLSTDLTLHVVICGEDSDDTGEALFTTVGPTDRVLILRKPFNIVEVRQLACALSEKWAMGQAAFEKIDRLEQMVQQNTDAMARLALYDPLTGLANRATLNDRLARSVIKANTDPSYRYALLFMDFDRFKLVNDSFGHDAGDRLIKAVSNRITGAVAHAGSAIGDALAARLGGDEFVVFIDQLDAFQTATDFADALVRALETPFLLDEQCIYSTASIGITTSEIRYQRAEEVLRDADIAMYQAKAAGKARWVRFDTRMHDAVVRRVSMEDELRHALDRHEMVLHYQPIVSLSTGQLHGFEALVRWKHPTRGMIPPLEFITCSEEIGLIVPLGAWVLEEACKQLKQWRAHYPHLADLSMAINVSVKQLTPAAIEQIERIIRDSGVNPSSLALEITESILISDPTAAGMLTKLRDLGVSLHVDDFGTGYSSLSRLHEFPLTGLKIDRQFIQNVSDRRDYTAVVNAIVQLAQNLGMKLIAEGIETAAQVALLQTLDCDCAQGYFFGRPCDAAGAELHIAHYRPFTEAA